MPTSRLRLIEPIGVACKGEGLGNEDYSVGLRKIRQSCRVKLSSPEKSIATRLQRTTSHWNQCWNSSEIAKRTVKASTQEALYLKNRRRIEAKGEAETLSRHTKKCATR